MTANVDGMVRDAIRAYRAGKKDEARALLERATEIDQNNEQAWMWLSAVVDSVDEQRICLENVLYLNPTNENAKRGLDILNKQSQETTVVSPSTPEATNDPFANASFTNSKSSADDSSRDKSFIPPTATSSASSIFEPVEEPSEEVYDDWVSGLNLGGTSSLEDFVTDDAEDSIGDEFENLFADAFTSDGDDSFGGNDDDIAGSRLDSLYDEGDSGVLTSGPFTSGAFFDDDLDFKSSAPKPSTRSTKGRDDLDDFDFDDDLDSLDDFLDDIPDNRSQSAKPRGKMSPVEKPLARKSGAFVSDDFGAGLDDVDPGEYFKAIPKEIQPTRIPGTDESYPVLVIMGLLLLILLNIGAAGLLAITLTG